MEEELDILPLFGTVAYPHAVTPLAVAQPAALRLLDTAGGGPRRLGVVALRDPARRPAEPTLADCFPVGVLALVHRLLRLPDGTLRVAVEGLDRIALLEAAPGPGLRARVRLLSERPAPTPAGGLASLRAHVTALAGRLPGLSPELAADVVAEEDAGRAAFLVAGPALARASLAQRQALLELDDPAARLAVVDAALAALPGADEPPPSPADLGAGEPGRALWLRCGPAGCELAWVEAAVLPGGGRVTITGRPGPAAHDAALVALSALRGCAAALSLDPAFARDHDVHIHLPARVAREEGPSCGGAVALALAGLLAGHAPLPGATILAELNLRGHLLPVPHLAEKLAAAEAAGLSTLILPAAQAHELAALPPGSARRIPAATLADALAALI